MAATTTMPSIFFLIFIFFFFFTSYSLQMPILTSTRMSFFPLDPAPPPPPSSSHSSFFPATSTPPPPPPTTFTSRPANISSLTFPHPTTPKSASRKLLIPALAAVISAALVTAILVLLYLRRRKHHSAFHVDTKSFLSDSSNRHPSADNPDPRKQLNHSGTSSEFLYLGTLVNTRPIVERSGSGSSNARFHFRKLESPELQPLPPLNSRRRNFHDGEMFSVVVEEDAEEYYSPRGSLSGSRHGSGSRRGLGDVAADLNSSRSNTTSSNSSSSSSLGSPERSHSGSTPSPVSLSPAKSESKSTEAQTELPRPPRIRSPALSPVFGSSTRVLAKSPQEFDKSGRALSSSPTSSLLSPISSSSEASMEKDPDESPATFNHLDRNGGSPSMTWASSSPDRDVVKNFGIYDVRSFSMISTSASPPRVFDRNVASPLQSSASSSPPRCSTKSSDASPGVSTSPDGTAQAQPSSEIGFSTGWSISSAPPPPPPPPACPPLLAKHVKDSVPATQNALSSNPDNEAEVEDVSRPKLKRLHWDKVRASSGREMVWDHLGSNSFKLDEEMIETLFVVTNPKNERSKEPVLPNPNQENGVLDPKKAQNIAILLRALDVTVEEVCEALLEGSIDTLGTELLENLQKMAPTKEEEWKLRDYKDNFPLKLGLAERFLKAVVDVPFAFKRVDAMLYMANFESEVDYLKKSFETLEAACEELRNSRMFLKLLEAVLKTGNRMNVGTNRGDARAFKLDTLLKLVDVKGADGKTTLLHFVVQEIMRAEGERFSTMNQNSTPHEDAKSRALGLEVVSGISSELINVKKAAGMDSDVLRSESSKLSKGLERVNEVIRLLKMDGSDEKFLVSMNKFLEMADEQLIRIQAQESVALSLVKEITEYFHGNSAKEEAHPFRIFTVVRDFLSILDHVCKEVSVIDERTTSSSTNNKFPIPVNPTAQQAVPGRHAMKQQYASFYEETATP